MANSLDLGVDANGILTFKKLQPGGEGSVSVNVRDSQGNPAIVDEAIRRLADKDIRECIKPYIARIIDVILERTTSATASESIGLFPPITTASALDTFEKYYNGNLFVHLHSCVNDMGLIVCTFILEKRDGKVAEYKFDLLDRQPAKLVDNFNVYHRRVRGYFINGRGQEQNVVTLGGGDRTWFRVEFDNPADDITKARILFPNWGDLEGPVK